MEPVSDMGETGFSVQCGQGLISRWIHEYRTVLVAKLLQASPISCYRVPDTCSHLRAWKMDPLITLIKHVMQTTVTRGE